MYLTKNQKNYKFFENKNGRIESFLSTALIETSKDKEPLFPPLLPLFLFLKVY